MFSFKNMAEKRMERDFCKGQLKSVESVFGKSLEFFQSVFPMGSNNLEKEALPKNTGGRYLGEIGINAFVHTQEMEVGQYPLFVNMIRKDREEAGWLHFVKLNTTSFLVSESRFSGTTARVLTNDIDLIQQLSEGNFNPPPPWIAWFEHGPFIHATQGSMEYWFHNVWDTYWERLSLEEQDEFFEKRRLETTSYISDSDWEDWIFNIKFRDPRTRDSLRRKE